MDGSTIERWPNRFSSSSFIDAKRRCTLGLITKHNAALAQSVERRSRKAKVAGSIPAGGSKSLSNCQQSDSPVILENTCIVLELFRSECETSSFQK